MYNLCHHSFTFFFNLINVLKIISAYVRWTNQKVGRKRQNPEEKTTWHTRKQKLACLTCALCGAGIHTRHRSHSGEMIKWLCANEISVLLTTLPPWPPIFNLKSTFSSFTVAKSYNLSRNNNHQQRFCYLTLYKPSYKLYNYLLFQVK